MIAERVKKVIKEVLVINREIKDTDNLENDLGCDSLDFVELWCQLEEEFLIDIDKDYAKSDFKTVEDVIKVAKEVYEKEQAKEK